MPKRIVDGQGVWKSDKLRLLREPWMKAEYANLLPLATANGTFECNPDLIWSEVYSYNRREITVEMVSQLLDELERVKLAFRWSTNGKPMAFWVGIDKPGRLPSQKRLDGKHEKIAAEIPIEELAIFLNGQQVANPDSNGRPVVNQSAANGCVGFGFGTGTGTGLGSGSGGACDRRSHH